MEMFLATHRLEHLHTALEQATRRHKDWTEPGRARQFQSTGQKEHPGEVDRELAQVETALSPQDHQLSHQHILL